MKGIIFAEFLDMVEEAWSLEMVNNIFERAELKTGGSYTSVGTYEYSELVALVVALSEETTIEVGELIYTFGTHLAGSFVAKFPAMFNETNCTFDVLKKIDDHIHVEVEKLYPDAELPDFGYDQHSDNHLILHYESTRSLGDLAHGLIDGCAQHFGEDIKVERKDLSRDGKSKIDFYLTKH